jgi:hypothetical protein
MSCSLRLDRPHMAEAGQGLVRFIPTGLSLFIAVTNRRESACFNWLTSPEAAPPFRARVVSFRPVKEAPFDAAERHDILGFASGAACLLAGDFYAPEQRAAKSKTSRPSSAGEPSDA